MIAGLQRRRLVQSGLAALTLGSYFLLLALAASPTLHAWLHHDAGQADHDCAVTTMVNDHIVNDVPPIVHLPAPGLAAISAVFLRPSVVTVVFSGSHQLEHAPPGLISA